nr:MAG TPA: hypothetical protein [Caudoviricetes sp.]
MAKAINLIFYCVGVNKLKSILRCFKRSRYIITPKKF